MTFSVLQFSILHSTRFSRFLEVWRIFAFYSILIFGTDLCAVLFPLSLN